MKKLRSMLAEILRGLAYELDPEPVDAIQRGLQELQRMVKAERDGHTERLQAVLGALDRVVFTGRVVQPDQPKPGDLYEFDWKEPSGDPFPPKRIQHEPVRVLDVKRDWVRYRIGMAFPDERMKVKMFLDCYRKLGTVVQPDHEPAESTPPNPSQKQR
jgi:hypothetical protein